MAKAKKISQNEIGYATLYDWSSGINDRIDPALLNDNESVILENASLDEKGTLMPSKGISRRYTNDISSSPISGIHPYYKNDGTTKILISTRDGKVYSEKTGLFYLFDTQSDWKKEGVYSNLDADSVAGQLNFPPKPNAQFIGTPTYDKIWV